MSGSNDNVLGARFAAEVPSAGAAASTSAGSGKGRSYLRSAPAPTPAAASAACADLPTESAANTNAGQQASATDDGAGTARSAPNFRLNIELAFFGLDFVYTTARVSPKSYLNREGGQRVAKSACICSARNALKATWPQKGKLAWFNTPKHVASGDFKL